MNLRDATAFMKRLLKTWESGSADSFFHYYHDDFKGTYLETSFDLADLRKRFAYNQSRYCSIINSLIAIKQLNNNQFFTLSHFFALDNVINQYCEMYVTNVIFFHQDKIQTLYSLSSGEINLLLPNGESNENITIKSQHKRVLIMQLIQVCQKESKALSARELECLYYYLFGKTSKEIGRLLHLSFRTVETHINNIKNKFGVSTKTDLMQVFNLY